MDPNSESTTTTITNFASLPVELCKDIFGRLEWADQRKARLTCRTWMVLINDLKEAAMTLGTPESVDVCKESFFDTIRKLRVKDLTTPLPIISSSRIDMPQAKELIVDEGVSQDNILLLLRYYTKHCHSLGLNLNSFAQVTQSYLLRNKFFFPTINEFSFEMVMKGQTDGSRTVAEQYHENVNNAGMISFLKWVKFPNLKSLSPTLVVRLPNDAAGSPVFTAFIGSFGTFLTQHGKSLQRVMLMLVGSALAFYPVIRQMQQCTNINNFGFAMMPHATVPDTFPTVIAKMVNSFKSLETLCFILKRSLALPLPVQIWLLESLATNLTLSSLLASPEQKITKLVCDCHIGVKFDFLQFGKHLKNLCIQDCHVREDFARPPPLTQPPMPHLSTLCVEFAFMSHDWTTTFLPWLISLCPSLKKFILINNSQWYMSLANVQLLVQSMSQLTYIQIITRSLGTDIEQWLGDSFPPSQVHVQRGGSNVWTINLSRPLTGWWGDM